MKNLKFNLNLWQRNNSICDPDPKTLPPTKEHEHEHGFIDKIMSTSDSDIALTIDPRTSIKYGTNVEAAKGIIMEYCNDSSIHGFKYMGDQKRPIIERVVWICAFILSICTCCYLIKNIWDKRSNTPVIVTFDEKLTPVWKIPFPTVTICPETKSDPRIFNYTKIYWMLRENQFAATPEELYFMDMMTQMCPESHAHYGKEHNKISEMIEAIERISLDFDDIIINGRWRNFVYINRKNFHKILTDEGPCYSFNSFDAKTVYRDEALVEGVSFSDDNNQPADWSLESGFNSTAGENTYPFRTLGSGGKEGLTLLLKGNQEHSDQVCQGPFHGFKLILNSPGEIPQVSRKFLSVPFDQKVSVSIKPKIVITSEGLHHYDPIRRQCYFQNERYLRYFKVYTQSNCELECLSNLTREKCGCVKFYMPRTNSDYVCGGARTQCINEVENQLLVQEFRSEFNKSHEQNITECNCLPTCRTVQYKAELEDFSSFDHVSLKRAFKVDFEDDTKYQMSILTISFKEASFNALRRSELYTLTDFIANCGGLLGLFMGVSILSVVELVSFLTIRLWINLRMRRKNRMEMKTNIQKPNETDNQNQINSSYFNSFCPAHICICVRR